jgi:hypothetical protein
MAFSGVDQANVFFTLRLSLESRETAKTRFRVALERGAPAGQICRRRATSSNVLRAVSATVNAKTVRATLGAARALGLDRGGVGEDVGASPRR